MDDDLYKILKTDINSSEEEIKKQYKKLALKHHPDKINGDEIMFKKITNAYNILSDIEKRKIYDTDLLLKEKKEGKYIFNDVFERDDNTKITVNVNLKEVIDGCEKRYEYIEKQYCDNCDGTGIENPRYNTIQCRICNGKGVHVEMSFLSCIECNGKGIFILHNIVCKKCMGKKYNLNKNNKNIKLNSNIKNDSIIKVSNLIELHIKHSFNKLNDYIIKYENNIISVRVLTSLIELICGFQKIINICEKTFVIRSEEIFDINNKSLIVEYNSDIKIIFKFFLNISNDDTKMIAKKMYRSFRDILRIKPFFHEINPSKDFEIINIKG